MDIGEFNLLLIKKLMEPEEGTQVGREQNSAHQEN
jgi:hypothetical protein